MSSFKIVTNKDDADNLLFMKKHKIEEFQSSEFEQFRNYKQLKSFDLLDWQDIAEVHVYNSPLGKGFAIIVQLIIEEITHKKAIFYGPESFRSFDWEIVEQVIS